MHVWTDCTQNHQIVSTIWYVQSHTEQIINGLDNEVVVSEILREIPCIKDINEATSDQILIWTWRVELRECKMKSWSI